MNNLSNILQNLNSSHSDIRKLGIDNFIINIRRARY